LNLYELNIFNRWGELIFSSTTPGEAWNGVAQGTVVQDGVYIYKLRYRALSDVGVKAEERIGHITVIL
jgi:gliding motility-associated-like protein